MRTSYAIGSLALGISLALAAPAGATRLATAKASARQQLLASVAAGCARTTTEPAGLCAPYDREHCRFEDGALQRGDLRDPAAPYTLRPVDGKPGLYCRYDSAMKFAGVDNVDDPATQKRKWDASKRRRR